MTVLLIAEHDNASLKDATNKALTAAAQMGGDVHVLVAGNNAGAAAATAAKLSGVAKVLHAESATLERPVAEPMAALIVSLAGAYDHIVAPATGNGKNVMPRVAALLDVMQISDISEVKSADTFVRLIYAGNAVQTVQSADAKKVITVRTASFAATGEGGSAAVETVAVPADPGLSSYEGENLSKSDVPSSPPPRSSSPVAAACRTATTSRCWTRWPPSSTPPSAPPAPPSMRATCRTTTRSARPARSLPPISTSRSASPAPSSTSPA